MSNSDCALAEATTDSSTVPATTIRVVHVVLSLDIGGLERIVADLVRVGRALGQIPSVICLERPGTLAAQVESPRGARPLRRQAPRPSPQDHRACSRAFAAVEARRRSHPSDRRLDLYGPRRQARESSGRRSYRAHQQCGEASLAEQAGSSPLALGAGGVLCRSVLLRIRRHRRRGQGLPDGSRPQGRGGPERDRYRGIRHQGRMRIPAAGPGDSARPFP